MRLMPTHSLLPSFFGGCRWSSPIKNAIVGSIIVAAALVGDFSIKLLAKLIEKHIFKQDNIKLTINEGQ